MWQDSSQSVNIGEVKEQGEKLYKEVETVRKFTRLGET